MSLEPLAFVAGALVGSFLNVVIHRVPRGESIVSPRSRCPSCGALISAWNNVPILSWLLLRGRCASCKAAISIRYPMVELLTALLWTAVVSRYGPTVASLAGVLLSSGLVVVTFVDLDIWEIPDEVTYPGTIIGALLRPWAFEATWYDGILGALAGIAVLGGVRWIFMRLRGVEGMGLGDVKLIAMLGAFLGLAAILPIVLLSSVLGALVGGVMLAWPRRPTEPTEVAAAPPPTSVPVADGDDDWVPPATAVPFGPFLSIAGLAELLVGPLAIIFSSFTRA